MANIKDLTVTQVKIFPNDYIPYAHLLSSDFIDYMTKKYNFRKNEMPFEYFHEGTPKILNFLGGTYNFEGNKIIIKRLNFEERRIIIEAMTSSKVSKKIFASIAKDIKKYDPTKTFKPSDVSFETEETSCLVTLNVNYMNIYSEEFKTFINTQFASRLEHSFIEIRPKSMSFEVDFEPDKELFKKHKVSLSSKTLTIQPRAGLSLEKKVFLSKSPFNSDKHLKLLEEFEKTFSN